MKYKVYCVKDELVGFNNPFYVLQNGREDQIATRAVKEAFDKGAFGDTAIDCTLYALGEFDDKVGLHTNYRFPEVIVRIADWITDDKFVKGVILDTDLDDDDDEQITLFNDEDLEE